MKRTNQRSENNQPDVFSVLVLDDQRCSFEWHARTVQETRAKIVPYKREVQPRLDTSTGQVNGERGTIGDLQTERLSLDRGKQVNFFKKSSTLFNFENMFRPLQQSSSGAK